MLLVYFKIALRNLFKHKLFSVINLFSLSISIACVLLLFLYYQHETSYDSFHEKSDRLYRAWIHEDHGGDNVHIDISTPVSLSTTLNENFSEIENVVRVEIAQLLIRNQGDAFEETLHMVDPSFLDMFDFEWLEGDQNTALNDVNNILITPRLAQKYFANENPMGKYLQLALGNDFEAFKVTGLIAEPPASSTIQYQMLIPFDLSLYSERKQTSWFQIGPETFVLLKAGVEPQSLQVEINELIKRILGDAYPSEHYKVSLQPMTDIHLDVSLEGGNGMAPLGDPVALFIVASVAILLIIISSINYTTISLGRLAGRALEVGMRKTIGAQRMQIVHQFWVEAFLMCSLAMILGFALAEVLLPLFNRLTGVPLSLKLNLNLLLIAALILFFFSIVAGGFPAMLFASQRPSKILSNRLVIQGDKSLVMRGLVVMQFSIAIILLVSAFTVAAQLDFFKTTELGFNKNNLLAITIPGEADAGKDIAELFVNESQSLDSITAASFVSSAPGEDTSMIMMYTDEQQIFRRFDLNLVGPDFFSMMGMELVEGRDFNYGNTADEVRALIVNQAFLRDYGWNGGVGNQLPSNNFPAHEIVGVVKDAYFSALTEQIQPMAFALIFAPLNGGITDSLSFSSSTANLLVRIEEEGAKGEQRRQRQQSTALQELEAIWNKVQPGESFDFYFVDDLLSAQYQSEERFSDIINKATYLAMIVAAIGLFGIAVLITNRRTKEIGVRKVMGGSVWSIVKLITNDFSKMVLISNLIAWPVAYSVMGRWLENFAYRIDLTPMIFIGSGLIALCIAWVTVGGTAAKAAIQKPVLSLRYE